MLDRISAHRPARCARRPMVTRAKPTMWCATRTHTRRHSRGAARAARARGQTPTGTDTAARARDRIGAHRPARNARCRGACTCAAKAQTRGRRTQIASFSSGMFLRRVWPKKPSASTRMPMGSVPINNHPLASGTSKSSAMSSMPLETFGCTRTQLATGLRSANAVQETQPVAGTAHRRFELGAKHPRMATTAHSPLGLRSCGTRAWRRICASRVGVNAKKTEHTNRHEGRGKGGSQVVARDLFEEEEVNRGRRAYWPQDGGSSEVVIDPVRHRGSRAGWARGEARKELTHPNKGRPGLSGSPLNPAGFVEAALGAAYGRGAAPASAPVVSVSSMSQASSSPLALEEDECRPSAEALARLEVAGARPSCVDRPEADCDARLACASCAC